MSTLKILKEENEVMELFIANALFYILTSSDVNCRLINKKSMYLIKVEQDIDYENDLMFEPLEISKIDNINSSMNRVELENSIQRINSILNKKENMKDIFYYYETLDENYLPKKLTKGSNAINIGSCFYTKGLRGYNHLKAGPVNIPLYKKILSLLGFITSTSYFSIKDIMEVNAVLIPKNTDLYLRAEFITYLDKETGETKHLRMISKKDPKNISLAKLYLLSLKMLAKNTISKNYEYIRLMVLTPTTNKPLNDKIIKLPVHNLSLNFVDELLKKIDYTNVNRDAKLALADYLLDQNIEYFSNMICTFSKTDTIMIDNYFEEMISMRTEDERLIYENEDIKNLGRGLNRLLRDKDGFSVQVNLLNCLNIQQLIEIIRDLNLLYFKKYNTYLLNDEQYTNILNLCEDTKHLKMVRDAVLTYSTIYINSIRNNKNIRAFGEGVNKFILDNSDISILEKLMTCNEKSALEKIIFDFNNLYKDKYEETLIEDEADILDLIKGDKDKKTLKLVIEALLQTSIKNTTIKLDLDKDRKRE